MYKNILYCTLCGRVKGTASALSVIAHGLHGGMCNAAQHVIRVIYSFSLSYTRNKAGKMQSTINQLKHGAIMVLGVWSR